MATPSVHYRVDLGGYQKKNSYVIQSAIGIDWENVPPELEQVFRTVPNDDILDFALGGDGQFYVKYRSGNQMTCKASADVVRLVHCDMASIDGLAIGGPASYWLRCNSPKHGRSVVMRGLKLARIQDPDARSTIRNPAIRFLNLGANRHYSFRLGDNFLTSHNGLRNKAQKHKNIMSAVISSFDPAHHLVIAEDGSIELAVPKAWVALFKRHMIPKNSLISLTGMGALGSTVPTFPVFTTPPVPKLHASQATPKAFVAQPAPRIFVPVAAAPLRVTRPLPNAPVAHPVPKPVMPSTFSPFSSNSTTTYPLVPKIPVAPLAPQTAAPNPTPKAFVIPPAPKVLPAPIITPPAPKVTVLHPLSTWSGQGNTISKLFDKAWEHPGKLKPRRVVGVYSVELPETLQSANIEYRLRMLDKAVESGQLHYEDAVLRFHGTRRCCQIGDSRSQLDLCKDIFCSVCSILRSSFSVARAGTAPGRNFQRFGKGIYTSAVSSKAHDYTVAQANSPFRAMFVASVSLGRGCSMFLTTTSLTGPPDGYDSVLGTVGVHLNYDEQVVYTNDAIRPEYLIIYEP